MFKGDADEETRALSDVTVDIGRGEYVSVSGPSGCGKSTFLAILALLESPTAGRYWLNGRATGRAVAVRARAHAQRRHRADLPELQPDRRHDGLRERRVPADGARRVGRRIAGSASRPRSNASASRARAKQRPGSLSGGHQQLVAIARAFAGRPPILLADEPTGNLDSKSGEAVMQMLDELHADGATVCLATHNPDYIARAERHIYLFDGRIVDTPVANDVSAKLAATLPAARSTVRPAAGSSMAPSLGPARGRWLRAAPAASRRCR